ncbi:MAG: ATP-dependent DNA helicase RecG, partial [Geminicoccaceae bacterium]
MRSVKHVANATGFSKGLVRPSADPCRALLAPVSRLKGVGPRLTATLAGLLGAPGGPEPRIIDLLWHLPHGVADRRLTDDLASGVGRRVTLEARIQEHQPPYRARQPYRVRCWTQAGFLHLVFFRARAPYLAEALPLGATRIVSGTLTRFGSAWQIVHPEQILTVEDHATSGQFQPLYPLTEGLSQGVLGRIISRALDHIPTLPEWQDPSWLERQRWPSFAQALRRIHRPAGPDDVRPEAPARRRLAYDELLASQVALTLVRGRAQELTGRALRGDGRLRRALLEALPFRLTPAQRAALAEIDADLARPVRMLRLLQGDVGSGKTLVAVLAMLRAVEAGSQAVLMVPTEVLAQQHYATLGRLLAPAGLAPGFLAGGGRGAKRRRVLEDLASGSLRIAIGTHALFQDEVAFADLGLAVIDEQHRFGVHQRLDLAGKGGYPDLLVMTATPIPRTLVLALYGDMASSELHGKPRGRRPIRTRVMPLANL